MTIKNNLNQKELISAICAEGIDVKKAKGEIRKTIESGFAWFRIGKIVATYEPSKRKKWCMMYR